jgi:hypothetical protein
VSTSTQRTSTDPGPTNRGLLLGSFQESFEYLFVTVIPGAVDEALIMVAKRGALVDSSDEVCKCVGDSMTKIQDPKFTAT